MDIITVTTTFTQPHVDLCWQVDGSFNDRNEPLRKSTSSLGRSESYKRSKSIPLQVTNSIEN